MKNLLDETYTHLKTISELNGNIKFSDSLQEQIQTIMFKTSCDPNWQIEDDTDDLIYTELCDSDDLLNKGLVTSMTFVLENVRTVSENTNLNGPNPTSLEEGHTIMDSTVYKSTGKTFHN